MKWFHVIGQGRDLYSGLNFYPWSERRGSIGARFVWHTDKKRSFWGFRYNPSLNKIFNTTYTVTRKKYETQKKDWPGTKEWDDI